MIIEPLALLFFALIGSAAASTEPAEEALSPHYEAISLVVRMRATEIEGFEAKEEKWHDAKDRAWSVRRPVHPGVLDTTHLFEVSYSIGGEVVGTWTVNTERGVVGEDGADVPVE